MSAAEPRGGEPLVLRSQLFVPVNVDRFVEKAHLRGADGIILDLEDSIAESEKATARTLLADAVRRVGRAGASVMVRINRPLRHAIPDLAAAVIPGVAGIWLPKCQSADHVRLIEETISELESERGLPHGSLILGVRVETADAFFRMHEIAAAHPRIAAFGLGGEDFSLSIGVEPSFETLIYPKQHAIIAAHAAGVVPLGLVSSGADFSNLEAMRETVRQSRRFGFEGASCIHPAVVPILNEGFRPTAEDVATARRIADSFDAAVASGSASIQVDGKMVDYPVAYRAQRLLARDAAVRRLEEKAAQAAS